MINQDMEKGGKQRFQVLAAAAAIMHRNQNLLVSGREYHVE